MWQNATGPRLVCVHDTPPLFNRPQNLRKAPMPPRDPFLPTAPPENELVAVGYITKAHGIRGEVVLVLQAESADILAGDIYTRPRHGGVVRPLRVTGIRRHHGNLLLTLAGVATRNDAEPLRSHTVFVLANKLGPLDEGEIYHKDLPGLRVFAVEDGREEREIGVIRDVSAPAGQDIWTILSAGGKEILFPAVENFVLDIDIDKGRATIAPPPGLLDLYLEDDAGRDQAG